MSFLCGINHQKTFSVQLICYSECSRPNSLSSTSNIKHQVTHKIKINSKTIRLNFGN